ncbi:MAG: hypothetical protein LUC90_04165 [Lachnospiraceae bacterium]|nr:hypothetical protein [Lachnospiraceae bacterium]
MKNATIAGVRISDFLSQGQGKATGLKSLQVVTGLDERTVRKAIEAERRAGVPILSDNKSGYYLPASEEETARFIRSTYKRAGEITRTAAAVEAAAGPGEGSTHDII